jgi:tRNA(Ile)-lysidine synthase
MLAEFESKVADFVKAHALLRTADKVLLAVSGGADSTVLLHLMCALKAMGVVNIELICAHLNHQLRGSEGDADEDFVIRQASGLNVPVITRRFDVRSFAGKNKLSIETAARELRIKNLLDIAKANGCDLIATGHQKNDNAETILQRLSRGTGFRGLGGIWPRRTFNGGIEFIRPLLCVRRAEIVDYLSQKSIKWRTDRTNIECSYRRNYIRHRLLPALQKQSSDSLVEELSELACAARRFYSLICDCADETWPKLANSSNEKVMLDLRMFSTQHPAVKVELIRRSLAAVGCGERDLAQKHYKRILQLAERNVSDNGLDLPGAFAAWREYNNLKEFQGPRGKSVKTRKWKFRGGRDLPTI